MLFCNICSINIFMLCLAPGFQLPMCHIIVIFHLTWNISWATFWGGEHERTFHRDLRLESSSKFTNMIFFLFQVDSNPRVSSVRWTRAGRYIATTFRHVIPTLGVQDRVATRFLQKTYRHFLGHSRFLSNNRRFTVLSLDKIFFNLLYPLYIRFFICPPPPFYKILEFP